MIKLPLQGIKVVELSTYVAAPGAARMLADYGAEVIKVEAVTGDQWRTTGKLLLNTNDEENPFFDIYNMGKKSISINIKHPEGKELLLKLINDADVFITNTRVNSLKKMGLDADSLMKQCPKLIYASVDGYGKNGPDAGKPGFDNLAFWARSGFAMDIPYQTETSYPLPATSGIGDCVSGGFLFAGIMMALFNREKTGLGDSVNVSLYNCGIWVMSSMLLRADPEFGGHYPVNPLFGDALTRNYKCADGEWVIISERIYDKDAPLIYSLLGVSEQVKDNNINSENYISKGKVLIPILEKAFLKKTSLEWIKEFRELDLVIEHLTHMKDVTRDLQALANGFVETIKYSNGNKHTVACPPLKFNSVQKKPGCASPLLGENTDEIMESFGYTKDFIQRLRDEGAVK